MSHMKYKNIIGEVEKEQIYPGDILELTTEGNILATNGVFIAALWNSMGSNIYIMDYKSRQNIPTDKKYIRVSKQVMDDIEFSPFRSDLLSTSCSDSTVKLWKIPEGGLTEDLEKEELCYKKKRKCILNRFNPVASDIAALFHSQPAIDVWNSEVGKSIVEISMKDNPTSLSWNPNGILVGATLKNKTFNAFDPRANKLVVSSLISEGSKSTKMCWIDNNNVGILCYTKSNGKEFRVFDLRKVKDDLTLEAPIQTISIDKSPSFTTPFYDAESEVLFTVGKGESTIKSWYRDNGVFKNATVSSSNFPGIFWCHAPRRFVDYEKCIIDTFIRYCSKTKSFVFTHIRVPRRNEGYEPELYPDVFSGEAALTADKWIAGENAEQIKKPIDTIENKFVSGDTKKVEVSEPAPEEKVVVDDTKVKELEAKVADLEGKIKELTEENDRLKKELEETKAKIPATEEA